MSSLCIRRTDLFNQKVSFKSNTLLSLGKLTGKTINMKQLLLFILTILLHISVIAQKEITSYGKLNKADMEMTECEFDKGAVACKLLETGNMFYDRGTAGITLFKTVYEKRIRIKILKDKGLSFANIEVPFYSHNNFEKLSKIDACTYNLDASGKVKVTDVDKSSVYIKKINRQVSRLVIAFPEVKVGSVIEYRYRLERETYNHIKDWYFQDVIPTVYSEYEINVPNFFVFSVQPTITDKMDEKQKEFDDVITVGNNAIQVKSTRIKYSMNNLVGIREEPHMAAARDYLQRIEFQLSRLDFGNGNVENLRTNWSDLSNGLLKDADFGGQLTKQLTELDPLVKEAMKLDDANEKIKLIYNTIRNGMRCYDSEAIYADAGISDAWKKKEGNAADINLLLINILRKCGIHANPILLSTRDNGLINANFPFLNQFNTMMAYVQSGNGFLVMDASEKMADYRLTPVSIVNTRGFIIEENGGRIFDVIDNTHHYDITVAIKGTIDEKSVMTGEGQVICSDYARRERVKAYLDNTAAFTQEYFTKPYPAVSVTDVSCKNSDNDTLPFIQKVNFSSSLNSSGEYSYFTTNLFSGITKNPFIEDSRITDIDFGFKQHYTIYGNFIIPEGYAFDALPQSITMSMPGKGAQFTRIMDARDNMMNMKINVDFNLPFYLSSDYGDFHEFYKKLVSSLNEQVVIKKKK